MGIRKFLKPSALVFLGATLLLTGCEERVKDQRFGFPEAVTEQGESVTRLWQFSMWVAIALGSLVLSLLFYSLIRHRRRSNDLPKQNEGNTALEIVYTILPFAMVALLFGLGLKVQMEQTRLANHDLKITVTGYQWNWRFQYPDEGITVVGGPQQASDAFETAAIPELVLPANQRVQFDLVSADVAHSFFVPGFLTKRDLIPGVRNVIEVTPKQTGTFVGHCAEYCGLNHSQMNFRVKIVSPDEFNEWVETKQSQGQV